MKLFRQINRPQLGFFNDSEQEEKLEQRPERKRDKIMKFICRGAMHDDSSDDENENLPNQYLFDDGFTCTLF